jgi:hypothetical protein
MSMTVTSITDLLRYKPNANGDYLVGNGFLSYGGSVLLTGEPGGGKSKWIQHLMFSFAMGLPFLGFTPARSLRILYVQNEDTMDDMHESLMGFVEQQGLGKAERSMIDTNCVLIHSSGVSGDEFVAELRREVETHKPDIVITDPLLAFIGCDLTDQVGVTSFLRDGMAPMLKEQRCGWICVHHSSKGAIGKFGGSKVVRGLGSIEIAAFFRGIIDLERKPSDPSISVMEVAKRAKQAGLRTPDGQPTNKLTVRTGRDTISWTVDAAAMAPAAPKPAGRPAKSKKDDVAAFVSEKRMGGADDKALTKAVAEHFGYSVKQARRYVTAS